MDLDCGDNSCRFAKNRGGMRTNGGCRCFENAGFGPSAVGAALQMLPEITRLRAEVENLRRVRDAAQEVVGVLGEQYMAGAKLWFPALDDLRAALDAEKRQADSTADHDNPSNHAGK